MAGFMKEIILTLFSLCLAVSGDNPNPADLSQWREMERMLEYRSNALVKDDVIKNAVLQNDVTGVADVNQRAKRQKRSVHEDLMQEIFRNYNKNDPPPTVVDVKVGIYIISYSMDEEDAEFESIIYFRQSWTDSRLQFADRDGVDHVHLISDNLTQMIWSPDLFFREAKTATSPGHKSIRINPDGTVRLVQKLSIASACLFEYSKFPFDQNRCSYTIDSFSYTAKVLTIKPSESPVDMQSNTIYDHHFTTAEIKVHDCTEAYTPGTFPCMKIIIGLARRSGYYIFYYYLPAILFVLISSLSFWLDVRECQSRILPSLVGVLGVLVVGHELAEEIRPASSRSAQIWTLTCLVFTLLALFEFFAVYFLSPKRYDNDKKSTDIEVKSSPRVKIQSVLNKFDLICRIGYPAAFLLFNIIYWPSTAS